MTGSVFFFCWDAVGCCLHSYNAFYSKFSLCMQADVFATVSSPVSLTPVTSLSPVLITPMVKKRWENLCEFFAKIRNDPNEILSSPGETDSWKKTWRRKSRVRLPLKTFSVGHLSPAVPSRILEHYSRLKQLDLGYILKYRIFVFTVLKIIIHGKSKYSLSINTYFERSWWAWLHMLAADR